MSTPRSSTRSVVTFLVGLAVVIAVAVGAFGWALPLVILSVLAIVMFHEFGHYLTARLSGMQVTDFFVGFGPPLWSMTHRGTRYGVRAIWAGGYVKVPGMSWDDAVDPALESRTYRAATYPRKVLFASAGSLMHLIMALLLAFSALVFVGAASPTSIGVAGFVTFDHGVANAARVAGLKAGDQIVSINGHQHPTISEIVANVQAAPNGSVTLVVLRAGRDVTLVAHPLNGQSLRVSGQPVTSSKVPVGYLGIDLRELTTTTPVLSAIPQSFSLVWHTLTEAVASIGHVFSPSEFVTLYHQVTTPALAAQPSQQAKRPVSIVGVVRVADQAVQSNVGAFLQILVVLNIFVGVLNMLPLLPLDGGHVAVATYERLRRRRGVPYRADLRKMMPVVYAFVTVLLVLFASTLYLDIAHPIANPFR